MRAAWYEKQGPAAEVLVIGTMPDPDPGASEVRIRLAASGINPGDVKKRQDAFGYGMPSPRVIPHSDGAGTIDRVGAGVPSSRIGERVWCYGAQSYRPFGTAAQYVVLPAAQAVTLPAGISFDQGACLGIPGITAHRAVHVAGPVSGKTVLVQGGAGAVGSLAVGLARMAGATVIATVGSDTDEATASAAGAHEVVRRGARSAAPVDHIIEVAFDANIVADSEVLADGGSIAAYATSSPTPTIPFWPLVFKNVRLYFLGSDDFPPDAKVAAAYALNALLESGWSSLAIGARFPLSEIAAAHERVESGQRGRVLVQTA
jgi:NADPH2:quinone reductase